MFQAEESGHRSKSFPTATIAGEGGSGSTGGTSDQGEIESVDLVHEEVEGTGSASTSFCCSIILSPLFSLAC